MDPVLFCDSGVVKSEFVAGAVGAVGTGGDSVAAVVGRPRLLLLGNVSL